MGLHHRCADPPARPPEQPHRRCCFPTTGVPHAERVCPLTTDLNRQGGTARRLHDLRQASKCIPARCRRGCGPRLSPLARHSYPAGCGSEVNSRASERACRPGPDISELGLVRQAHAPSTRPAQRLPETFPQAIAAGGRSVWVMSSNTDDASSLIRVNTRLPSREANHAGQNPLALWFGRVLTLEEKANPVDLVCAARVKGLSGEFIRVEPMMGRHAGRS